MGISSKDSKDYIRTGQTTVGTSAVKVAGALADGNLAGVLVKAYGADDVASNTVPVFIGNSDQVTVNDGFPIAPGEAVTVPIFGDNLYAIASSASQTIAWILA